MYELALLVEVETDIVQRRVVGTKEIESEVVELIVQDGRGIPTDSWWYEEYIKFY